MKFTTFSCLTDNVPFEYEGWDTFLQQLKLRVCDSKESVPLYCPGWYLPGKPRKNEYLIGITFGPIDVDDATEEQVEEVMEFLIEEGIYFIFHTTHSILKGLRDGKFKGRFIFRFNRVVEPDEWPKVWRALNELCGGLADQACKNPSRIYFYPSCPPEAEDVAMCQEFDGDVLDVDELIDAAPKPEKKDLDVFPELPAELLKKVDVSVRLQLAQEFMHQYPIAISGEGGDIRTFRAAAVGCDYGLKAEEFWPILLEWNQRCRPAWTEDELQTKLKNAYKYHSLPFGWKLADRAQGDAVGKEHVEKLAKRLGSSSKKAAPTGRWIEHMLKGKKLDAGAAQTVDRVAPIIARWYPYADAMGLALLFEKCIEESKKGGVKDVDIPMLANRIERAQGEIHEEDAQKKRDDQATEQGKIEEAFRSVGMDERSTPYTSEEVSSFAKAAGFDSIKRFKRRWVIQFGKGFYFFVGGRYTKRPYMKEEAATMADIALKPARLDLFREGQNGPVPLSLKEIVERYGTIANAVVADMKAQISSFDEKSHTLIEAPCPFRKMEPKRDERVEAWLRSITKDDELHERLLDWLACVPLLERPMAALFLWGEPRTGKSLLAHGISRMWLGPTQGGPTELEDLAGDFNSKLMDCPLVFGDEYVPEDKRGNAKTDLLRKIVQETVRTLKRKFLPAATLLGAIRLIIAANEPDIIINTTKSMTNHDIAAVNERFLCIEVDATAREFLDQLRKEGTHDDFFSGDVIAQHVWWLHENRDVKFGSRFLVEGLSGSELEKRMMVGTGLRSSICEWFTSYILADDHKRKMTGDDKPIVDQDKQGRGRLLVTSKALHRRWEHNDFTSTEYKPTITQIEKALGGVCREKRVKKEGGVFYREVNIQHVKYWASVNGYSEERFDKALIRLGLHPTASVVSDPEE